MKKDSFEGWYFKHQKGNQAFAVIPGMKRDRHGRKSAFIQIISDGFSAYFPYSMDQVEYRARPFHLKIGDSVFTRWAVSLNLKRSGAVVEGKLWYGPLRKLEYDIMGVFALIPGLECRHDVISMGHRLEGAININGKKLDFTEGTGYIESDRGRSFPGKYLWTQCSDFIDGSARIMAAAAMIPMGPWSFPGCICAVILKGKGYSLATYLGAKVMECSGNSLILRQGDLCFKMKWYGPQGLTLKAPVSGAMTRSINESLMGAARYRLTEGDKVLLDVKTRRASFEYSE